MQNEYLLFSYMFCAFTSLIGWRIFFVFYNFNETLFWKRQVKMNYLFYFYKIILIKITKKKTFFFLVYRLYINRNLLRHTYLYIYKYYNFFIFY